DAGTRLDPRAVRHALPRMGRRKANGAGRPVRLLRPHGSHGRRTACDGLRGLATAATEGRVPRRGRLVHVPEPDRQRPERVPQRYAWRLDRWRRREPDIGERYDARGTE